MSDKLFVLVHNFTRAPRCDISKGVVRSDNADEMHDDDLALEILVVIEDGEEGTRNTFPYLVFV